MDTSCSASSPTRRPGNYVLITPARNEESLIGNTIESVIVQTKKPLRWVIVSDGSTDGTDAIVSGYAATHPWITLVRMPEHRDRNFAAKATAFAAGTDAISDLDYEFIGALDADISFGPDYFAFLLEKLSENSNLGLVGTPFEEEGTTYDYRFASVEHVSGACQFFRRTCFEAIGGYRPMKSGGIDLVAVLSARLHGWEVRTFIEKTCIHHRKQGSATRKGLAVFFNDGRKDYLLGAHPAWELLRAMFHTRKRPYVVGGVCLCAGYFWPMLCRQEQTAPADVIAFRRRDQMLRLRSLVSRVVPYRKAVAANHVG